MYTCSIRSSFLIVILDCVRATATGTWTTHSVDIESHVLRDLTQERMTTNKKKAANYYAAANVKNKNRSKAKADLPQPNAGKKRRR